MPDLTHAEANKHLRHWLHDLRGDLHFKPRLRLVRLFQDSDTIILEQVGAQDSGNDDGASAAATEPSHLENPEMAIDEQ